MDAARQPAADQPEPGTPSPRTVSLEDGPREMASSPADDLDRRPGSNVGAFRATIGLLACGLLISLGLHVWRMASLTTLVHDDGISYMAATGHQGAYQRDLPFDQWGSGAGMEEVLASRVLLVLRNDCARSANLRHSPTPVLLVPACLDILLWHGPLERARAQHPFLCRDVLRALWPPARDAPVESPGWCGCLSLGRQSAGHRRSHERAAVLASHPDRGHIRMGPATSRSSGPAILAG